MPTNPLHPSKYFHDNINRLPKGIGGTPADPQAHNLQWGLYEMAKLLEKIQSDQIQLAHQMAALERTVASKR